MTSASTRHNAGAHLTALLGSVSLLTVASAMPAFAGEAVAQAEEIPETVLITGSLIRGTAAVGVPVKARDGVFGAQTRAYVLKWQKAHRVRATGNVDAATWRAMGAWRTSTVKVRTTTIKASTPAVKVSPLAQYKRVALTVGSRGAAVKAVQAAVGVPAKDRDGVFGAQTRACVLAWQKAHKVRATGVVDAATWKALGA